jgi:hypothetical protein
MPREIEPLEPSQIGELSRFLIEGFHAPNDAEFAAPDMLAWKYFDAIGRDDIPRSFVARDEGKLIGHIGLCPTAFRILREGAAREATAVHVIDWLASPAHPGTGSSLLRKAQTLADATFGLGMTASAKGVSRAFGYQERATIPIFQRVFRPTFRLRSAEDGTLRKGLRAIRDVVRIVTHRARRPKIRLEVRKVDTFGPEIEPILNSVEGPLVLTRRDTALLNHFLRHPRARVDGYLLFENDHIRGYGLVSLVPSGRLLIGKVVDCILDTRDPAVWHAAIAALARVLESGLADVAQGCGSAAWIADAFRGCGFRAIHNVVLTLRDRRDCIPDGVPFYLTFLEGDYAYTP